MKLLWGEPKAPSICTHCYALFGYPRSPDSLVRAYGGIWSITVMILFPIIVAFVGSYLYKCGYS